MKQVDEKSSKNIEDHENNGSDTVPIRSKVKIVSNLIDNFILNITFLILIKSNASAPTTSKPVIKTNGKAKRIVPRSYDEWGK